MECFRKVSGETTKDKRWSRHRSHIQEAVEDFQRSCLPGDTLAAVLVLISEQSLPLVAFASRVIAIRDTCDGAATPPAVPMASRRGKEVSHFMRVFRDNLSRMDA